MDPGHGYQREDAARARKQHYDAVGVVAGQAGGPPSTTLTRAVRQVKKSVAGVPIFDGKSRINDSSDC